MEELDYPEIDAHRREHEEFRLMARRMADRLARQGATPVLADELLRVVRRWLSDHIEKFDRAVAEYRAALSR